MCIELKVVNKEYEEQISNYKKTFIQRNESIAGAFGLAQAIKVEDWIRDVILNQKEETMLEGLVPATTYMAIRKSDNKLNGVTTSVLLLPVLTKLDSHKGIVDINFKESLESIFLKNINSWRDDNLTENLLFKRRRALENAG